jgi:hypothetical protein
LKASLIKAGWRENLLGLRTLTRLGEVVRLISRVDKAYEVLGMLGIGVDITLHGFLSSAGISS